MIDLRQSLRGKCIGKKWWKKLQAFRKKQFFRMRFHDIEKAIDSKRRRMNRKPLAQQKQENEVEQVFASRRTRQSRNSVDVGETEAQRLREEERLAKRQKPKRKKFKVVMRYGFEQSIPCDMDEEEEVPKNVSVDQPITVKRRKAKLKQRNRDQGIAVLKSLRSRSAAHEHTRKVRSPAKLKPSSLVDAADLSGAAARHMVRRLNGARPVYVPFTYNVLSEPSDLERAAGVYHLGLVPTGDVAERARKTLRLEA